jgi:hypothetical protein
MKHPEQIDHTSRVIDPLDVNSYNLEVQPEELLASYHVAVEGLVTPFEVVHTELGLNNSRYTMVFTSPGGGERVTIRKSEDKEGAANYYFYYSNSGLVEARKIERQQLLRSTPLTADAELIVLPPIREILAGGELKGSGEYPGKTTYQLKQYCLGVQYAYEKIRSNWRPSTTFSNLGCNIVVTYPLKPGQ